MALFGRVLADAAAGFTIHDGALNADAPDRRDLGSRVLVRPSPELGYAFARRHGVSLYASHASDADMLDDDEGLDNAGIRDRFSSAPKTVCHEWSGGTSALRESAFA